ncbi:MAG: cell division protein FtsA [Candidatus Latescibacterota bacterium]|nr:MAG: cell division protein FtsA [Candidatus Latescibacterota bacterium]
MNILRASEHIVGSIDMGTTKVSAILGERRDDRIRVIGIGNTSSEGLKQGVVVDIDRAAGSVRKAVLEAERMAGVALKRYNIGVAGEHIRSMNSRGVVGIPSPDHEITREDVVRTLNAGRSFALPSDREILHTLPQQYIVDNQAGIQEPCGMYGSRLEARVHVVTASRHALDNIAKTLDNARLEIGELVLEPLASSQAVLTTDEREIGVMLIDVGGGTTDVMVYSDNGVLASGVIGIGGNNITSDVAYGLRTAMKSAEVIKIEHGCALSAMVDGGEKIEVPGIGFRETKQVGKQLLSAIIEPRVKELFSLINDQINKNDFKRVLGAGVVVTGGSSMLSGTRELAEQVFDLPVRVGTPMAVEGLTEVVSHPMYATGVGLLLYSDASEVARLQRASSRNWWRHSFSQLRRAIASII